ncbi:MAG: hypothetical protein V1857_02760, partial [archaeon]
MKKAIPALSTLLLVTTILSFTLLLPTAQAATTAYYPSSSNIPTGSYVSGDMTSLINVDANYYIAKSAGSATSSVPYNPSAYALIGGTSLDSGAISDLARKDEASLGAAGGYMIVGDGTPHWGSVTGTISFWVRWASVAGRPWGEHEDFETRTNEVANHLTLDWGETTSITSSTVFTADKWYFIAIVWNENTNILCLYVGDQTTPPTQDSVKNPWTAAVSSLSATGNNFMASKGGIEALTGLGDELRYWNTDRTLAQIQSDYGIELTGSEANLRSYFKLNNNFNDAGPNNNSGSGSGTYLFVSLVPFGSRYMTFRSYPTQTSTTSLSKAIIGYRSNTGASLSTPKARSWSGSAWDASEMELSTSGSPVRWVRAAYCPLMGRYYEKIMVTLSDDGYLDAYVWTGSGWSVTNNIGFTDTTTSDKWGYRPFDVTYEKTSGKAVLVYGIGSTNTTRDLAYKIWDGSSWSTEGYINDSGHTSDVEYYWVSLASKPTSGANEIALVALEGTTAQGSVRAWIWNGASWGNELGLETATTKTVEDIGVAYESLSGYAMFVWGDNSVGAYNSRRWLGSSWEGSERLVTNSISGAPGWISLKADPASNRIMFLTIDSLSDLWTVDWNPTTWTTHSVHDTGVDIAGRRCADGDWEPTESKYLMVYGTDGNKLAYKTWNTASGWSSKISINADGRHYWVQLRRNPRNVSGDVKILGAMLNDVKYLGALKWDGSTLTNIGDTVFTADTVTATWPFECFDLEFQPLGDPSEYTSEVEFTGSSNSQSWIQLVWTVDSAWTTTSVAVTIQLYNYTSASYATSGNGYLSYTSSGTANTDETKTQTITLTPQDFRNGSGNWKIKIKGIKSASTQFGFNVDWVEYKPAHCSEYTVSTEFLFSGMTSYPPTQLAFTVVSQCDIASANVTIQVYNYQSSQYATSGQGYLTYVSSGTPSTDETKTLTITTSPSQYVSSGNAKIRITGVKATTTQFQQKTNQAKLDYVRTITKIVFTTTAQTLTAGQASAVMVIQTQDASSNPVNVDSNTAITLTSTSVNGKFSIAASPWVDVTSVTITTGSSSVNFYYKDTIAGTPTIAAAENPSQGWTDATQQETVNPAALDHFTFASISSPKTAGTSFTVTIMARDVYNNNVTSYTSSNSLSDSTGTISPTSTTAFAAGTWTGSVTITKSQTGITIATSGGGKSGTSGSFTVNPAVLDHFTFATISSPKTAGTSFTITIMARDAYNNNVTTYTSTNTLSDSTGTISPTSTGAFSSGIWSNSVTITKAQTGVTITTSGSGKSGTSNSFTVNSAVLDHFTFASISNPQAAGVAFSITVTSKDLYNNTVTSYTSSNALSDLTGTISPASTGVFSSGTWTGSVTITKSQIGVTITTTGSGKSGTSNSFNVNAGALGHFIFSTISSPQTAGTAFSITITGKDGYNNTVTAYTGTNSLSDSTATISPTSTSAFSSGTWTGTVTITKSQAGVTIATSGSGRSGTSNSFNMNAGTLDRFIFNTVSSPQTAGASFSITITSKDAYNNTVTGYTGSNSLSDSTGTITPTSTGTFTAGVWSGNIAITKAQTGVTITTTGSSKSGTSNSLNVNPGALDRFIFTSVSTPQTAGVSFTITITSKDAYNNPVTTYSSSNSLSDSTGTISPTATGAFSSGTWSGSVAITKVQTGITITTSGGGKSGTSNSFTVSAAALDHFAFTLISNPQSAGVSFTVTITSKDVYNNTVTGYSGSNSLADSTGTVSPTSTGAFSSGVWTGSVTITKSQGGVTITTSGGSKSGTSNSFNVNAGPLDHFLFASISSPQTAGVSFTVTITSKDAYNNNVTSYASSNTLSDSTGTITPTSTGAFTAGTWTGSVTVTKAQSGITITTSGGGKSGSSNSFNVNAGSLDHFTFASVSSPQAAGVSFTITITGKDTYNNTITTYTGSNSLNDSTGTINPTATGSFTGGTWTGSVTITKAQTGISITTTGGGKSGTSNSFNIDASSELDHFAIAIISSPQTAGVSFTVTITSKDAYNNTVTMYSGSNSLSDSTGTISPTATGAFSSGVWTGSVTITKAQTGITITTSSSGKSGTSNSFSVNPAALDHFTFASISSLQIAGTGFTIAITSKDAYNNTVTAYTGSNTLSDLTGTIAPTTTGAFSSGVWSGSVTITKSQTGISIATSGSGKSGTSNSFNINVGSLDHFTFNTITGPQTAGVSFTITIMSKDAYNNTVTAYAGSNTLSDSTGTISPTSTSVFSSGVWIGSVTITKAQTGIIITTTGSGKSGNSNSLDVNAGALNQFLLNVIISPQTAGLSFTVTITSKDSFDNTVTTYSGSNSLSDSTGTLTPTSTGLFTAGLWTGSVTVTKAQSGVTIITSGGGKSGTSNSFSVNADSLDHFIFTSIGTQTAGVSFSIT